MDSKFLKISKKIIAIMMVTIILGTNVTSAFSFLGESSSNTNSSTGIFDKLKNALSNVFNFGTYDTSDLRYDLTNMQNTGNFDFNKIKNLVEKLPSGQDKNILSGILGEYSKFSAGGILGNKDFSKLDFDLSSILSGIDLSSILDMLLGLLIKGEDLPVEADTVQITAQTAGDFAGSDYEVKLNANIYRNGNSNKWAVLIHPFMLNGKTIVKSIGSFYYEQGYNIIAPDLRGFGDSEGSVALGFLESLDVYDWLWYLNEKHKPSQVIIHGVSLGAATTNFLSGIDKFILEEDKTRIEREIKPLKNLNVVGLVEDCGYAEMTQFAPETFLKMLGIGIEENFEYYSNAENSLQHCNLPVLVIHGTSDTMVDYENATVVQNAVTRGGGKVTHYKIEGGAHAGILMGSNSEEYKQYVQAFIKECEANNVPTVDNRVEIEIEGPKPPLLYEQETKQEDGFLDGLLNKIKGLFKW